MLTHKEQGILAQYSIDLGRDPEWSEYARFADVGPSGKHIVSSAESLSRDRAKAVLAGLRLGLAGLARLKRQVNEARYPWSYILFLGIEDSWLITARTPPELLFQSARDSAITEERMASYLHSSIRIDPLLFELPAEEKSLATQFCWFVREPLDCDYRYFVDVYSPNEWLDRHLDKRPVAYSAQYARVLRRLLRVHKHGD
jgi:hypothetical protein